MTKRQSQDEPSPVRGKQARFETADGSSMSAPISDTFLDSTWQCILTCDDDQQDCPPVASGSRPRPEALPRSANERFVAGLDTFVGGLQMSRSLNQNDAEIEVATEPSLANPPYEPPPLVMSRQNHASIRPATFSESNPLQNAQETTQTANFPLVPGVSPGWHVETQGLQAMDFHDGIRFQDEDGWTPLDSFPAKTRQGKLAVQKARLERMAPRNIAKMQTHSSKHSPAYPAISNPAMSISNLTSGYERAMLLSPTSSSSRASSSQDSYQGERNQLAQSTIIRDPSHYSDPRSDSRQQQRFDAKPSVSPKSTRVQDPAEFCNNTACCPLVAALYRDATVVASDHQQNRPNPPFQHLPSSLDSRLEQSYSLDNFEVLDTLGTGTFGRVLLVRLKQADPADPKSYFALKVLAKSEVVRLKQVEHINSERNILQNVDHPFLVNMFCTFQDSKNCYMLMEYVVGGEIFSYLRRAGRFSTDVSRFYISTIVLAIEYLHERDIVYRDLKPENLLIDSRGYTKITDFGFAKQVKDRTWTLCGTPEYLAPEIIESNGHGKAVDWWALGVLLFEMLAGYPPFYDAQPFGVYEKILIGKVDFPDHVDSVSRDLIRRLLTADRSKRLGNLRNGAQDVKNHVWFQGVNWVELERGTICPPIIPYYAKAGDSSNFSKYEPARLSTMPGFSSLPDEHHDHSKAFSEDAFHHLFPSF